MEPFHEMTIEKWPLLQSYLQENWPRSFIVTNWMNIRFQWIVKSRGSKEYSFHILAPDGDLNNGIITFGRTGCKSYYLTMFLFNDCTIKMEEALLKTKLIDWNENMVCGIPTGHENWFKNILKQRGHSIHHDTPTHYYRIPQHVPQSYEIDCPEDVYVDFLKEKDVEKIDSLWQHRFKGSDDLIKECIKMNYGSGVYSKTSNELLSWVIKFEYGDVSILQTEANYRKRGYARLAVQSLCKKISDDGEDMLIFIVPGNTSSENLFTSLGAQYAGSYNWIEYDTSL